MIDNDPPTWRLSPRTALSAPSIVFALMAALAVATALAGCGSTDAVPGSSVTTPTGAGKGSATAAAKRTAAGAGAAKRTGTDARKRAPGAATPTRRASALARPTIVATVRHPVAMRSAAGHAGRVLATIAPRTQFGSSTAVPVVRRRGGWLGVTSVLAGNGRLGWIPAAATSLTRVSWRIYISLDRQQITVLYDDQIVRRIRTSTGVAGARTPTGDFAVTDRLSTGVQYGPYGCCILALSAIQPLHLSDWDGGNRIAIHATDDTAALGEPASHGCAHVADADGRWLLAHIPDATPVVIGNAAFHPGDGSPA